MVTPTLLHAQVEPEVVVTLIDGSEVSGTIIESTYESITIDKAGYDPLTIKDESIQSVYFVERRKRVNMQEYRSFFANGQFTDEAFETAEEKDNNTSGTDQLSYALQRNKQVRVVLNNGKVVYGRIRKYESKSLLTLRPSRGPLKEVFYNDIDRIYELTSSGGEFLLYKAPEGEDRNASIMDEDPATDELTYADEPFVDDEEDAQPKFEYQPNVRVILTSRQVIEGQLIEQRAGEYIRLRREDGEVIRLNRYVIKKVISLDEENPVITFRSGRRLSRNYRERIDLTRPIYGVIDFAFNWQTSGGTSEFGGIHNHYTVGYQWKPYLGFGLGTGFDILVNSEQAMLFAPIFTEIRGYIIQKPKFVAPYYRLAAGFNIANSNQDVFFNSNFFLKPALGLRIASRRRGDTIIEMGYHFQSVDMTYFGFDFMGNREQIFEQAKLRRFYIGVGRMF